MTEKTQHYYVPEQSAWPIIGAVGLFLIALGAGTFIPAITSGEATGYSGWILLGGVATIIFMVTGWFNHVIKESLGGLYSAQMDRSFRQGMSWFIFSEVMFFAAFFGALFYARVIAVPWLAGEGNNAMTNAVLWPGFENIWPVVRTPGGTETEAMGWFGLPLLNTMILVTSSWTVHMSQVALEGNQQQTSARWLGITVLLGAVFLFFQGEEYLHAWNELHLTLQSGIYGNTFFMLTGFHGLHVTLGTLMLFIVWLRMRRGHFTAERHFAFQASSWYWHFVDVVWLGLFIFVYVI